MRAATVLRLSSTALVATGGLALAVAGSETASSGAAMAAVAAAAVVLGSPRPRGNVARRRFWNFLAVLALVMFLGELALTHDLLAAVVRLVVFLTSYKLFNIISTRDYYVLFMFSFFQLLAAASISYDYRFALPFALFIVFSSLSLWLHTLVAGRERESQARMISTGLPQREEILRLGLRRIARQAALGMLILVLAIAFFPFLPRLRTDVLGPAMSEPLRQVSGFSSVVDLGAIGRIKTSDRVVMHVTLSGDAQAVARRPKLRGIVLTNFDGRRWYHSMSGGRRLNRSRDGRIYPPEPSPGPRIDEEIILKPLDTQVIFASGRVESLRGPFDFLYTDTAGSLFLRRFNYTQIRYEVIANLPESSTDLPAGIPIEPAGEEFRRYLQIPWNEQFTPADRQRIRELTERVTAGSNDLLEAMRRIERHLQTNYRYTLDLRGYRGVRSKLISFLFERREGHCEFFASAMVMMARSMGVPARLVNGFQLGQHNPIGDFYTVRAADAHSWAEIYFPGHGWVEFDPTPAGGQTSDFANAAPDLFSGLLESIDMLWIQHVLAYDAVDQQQFIEDLKGGAGALIGIFNSAVDALLALIPNLDAEADIYPLLRSAVQVLIAAALLALAWFAVIRPLLRRGAGVDVKRRVPFFERTVALLRRRLRDYDFAPGRTARELAAETVDKSYGPIVAEIVELYERARFGEQKGQAAAVSAGNARVRRLERMLREDR
jgi:transglutaminase-like putative cysteine protease